MTAAPARIAQIVKNAPVRLIVEELGHSATPAKAPPRQSRRAVNLAIIYLTQQVQRVAALSETRPEKLQDALRSYEEFRKLSNARFAASRLIRPKDYVAGKAYLRWKYAILKPNGDRYEATLLACRTEAVLEGGPLCFLERDGYVYRLFDGDDKPVFVGEIELINGVQEGVRSSVWHYLTHQAGGEIAGPRLQNVLLQPGYEVTLCPGNGEVSVFRVAIVGDRTRGNQVVERGAEVVDSVPDHQREPGREHAHADHIAITIGNWIELGPGRVRFCCKEFVGGTLKFVDMGFCPMKL